jgi:hypothetical protein
MEVEGVEDALFVLGWGHCRGFADRAAGASIELSHYRCSSTQTHSYNEMKTIF